MSHGSPAVAMENPTPPTPHVSTEPMNIGGAHVASSIAALTIAPPPASMVSATISSSHHCYNCGHSTAPNYLVKGNNDSSKALSLGIQWQW